MRDVLWIMDAMKPMFMSHGYGEAWIEALFADSRAEFEGKCRRVCLVDLVSSRGWTDRPDLPHLVRYHGYHGTARVLSEKHCVGLCGTVTVQGIIRM
jgi:hypothetical protein